MRNVLLVDDDSVCNFINKKILELTGLVGDIAIAENGLEALQLLNDYYQDNLFPDLILLDINMPVMNGFEFIREFDLLKRSFKSKVEIVIMSSSDNRKDIQVAESLELRYLVKPLITDNILLLLANKEFR